MNTHNIIVQFCSKIIQINTQLSRANISTCQQHIYLLAWLNHRNKNDDKKRNKNVCWKVYNAGHNQIEMIIDILIWVILSNLIVKCMMGMNVLCWKIVLFCKLNMENVFYHFCFLQRQIIRFDLWRSSADWNIVRLKVSNLNLQLKIF